MMIFQQTMDTFQVGKYNWLGQRLLTLARYTEIAALYDHAHAAQQPNEQLIVELEPETTQDLSSVSGDYLTYLNAIALLRTTATPAQVIEYMQLNCDLEQDAHSLLLVCQCLLYRGDCTAIVDLCSHAFNKLLDLNAHKAEIANEAAKHSLTDEPKLWHLFGVSLERTRKLNEARVAFEVSALLAARHIKEEHDEHHDDNVALSAQEFDAPHVGKFELLAGRFDMRALVRMLEPHHIDAHRQVPLGSVLQSIQSLLISYNGNESYSMATDVLNSLNNHAITSGNPSSSYNRLALQCRGILSDETDTTQMLDLNSCLEYLLVRAFVCLNKDVHLNHTQFEHFYESTQTDETDEQQKQMQRSIFEHVDKVIACMRTSDPSCSSSSASLWSNLAACYLLKRQFISCLACLTKAQQIDPLDWRVCYNTALVCLHVGQITQALANLNACITLHRRQSRDASPPAIIKSLLAICYDELGETEAARRTHIEATRAGPPLWSLVNYLTFLHANRNDNDDVNSLMTKLCTNVEQNWLQRAPGDSQWSRYLLRVVSRIDASQAATNSTWRPLAWAKED